MDQPRDTMPPLEPADLDARIASLPIDLDASPSDPVLWVQMLVIEGLLLGAYQRIHTFTDDEWESLLAEVSRYGGAATPQIGHRVVSVDLDAEPFRDPSRPLLDAVLMIATTEGLAALTFERVAELSGRSLSFLESAFGSADELLHDVIEQAYGDGFDDLSTLRDDLSPESITQYLALFESSRQVASVYRVLALTGVVSAPRVLMLLDLEHRQARETTPSPVEAPRSWLPRLALDGWDLGSTAAGYPWMPGVPGSVSEELTRLVRLTAQSS